VILGNKDIERAFCEVNACNEHRDMNVCESNDFYCSKKCSAQTDSDCGTASPVPEIKEPVKSADEIIEEAKKEVEKELAEEQPEELVVEKEKLSLSTKLLIYIILYVVAFIVLRRITKR
jgi:hypothetical protein